MFELSPLFIALLVGTGLIAGIINTLAGGGSNLTVPALMVLGLPADIANATNRVGVFLQCLVATRGFDKRGKLERQDIGAILIPTLIGSAIGAMGASYMPASYLKPVLLLAMILMALIILIRPETIATAAGESHQKMKGNRRAWISLFIAGLYGGFVQAGVGFILIAALAGSLRYDLIRANALKMLCTGVLTSIALVIFIWRGQVMWVPGLILAAGTMAGAQIGVKFAIKTSQQTMKWFLLIMTLLASAAAMWF